MGARDDLGPPRVKFCSVNMTSETFNNWKRILTYQSSDCVVDILFVGSDDCVVLVLYFASVAVYCKTRIICEFA